MSNTVPEKTRDRPTRAAWAKQMKTMRLAQFDVPTPPRGDARFEADGMASCVVSVIKDPAGFVAAPLARWAECASWSSRWCAEHQPPFRKEKAEAFDVMLDGTSSDIIFPLMNVSSVGEAAWLALHAPEAEVRDRAERVCDMYRRWLQSSLVQRSSGAAPPPPPLPPPERTEK